MNIRENYTSQNLFEKVNYLTEEQINKISNALKWTTENVPNAVLIGGTATIHYISGSRNLTPDIDYLVNDINNVKSKLSFNNIQYDILDVGLGYSIGITVDDFNVDFLDSSIGNVQLNKLILSTSNTAMIGGYSVNINNPELLAIMKIELGRDKDTGDGFAMLNSGKLNKAKYVGYLNTLKNGLSDYNTLHAYSNFIS